MQNLKNIGGVLVTLYFLLTISLQTGFAQETSTASVSLASFSQKLDELYPAFFASGSEGIAFEVDSTQLKAVATAMKSGYPKWGIVYFNGKFNSLLLDGLTSDESFPKNIRELGESIRDTGEGFLKFYDMLVVRPLFKNLAKEAVFSESDELLKFEWFEENNRYRTAIIFDRALMVKAIENEDLKANAKNVLLPTWEFKDGVYILKSFASQVFYNEKPAFQNLFEMECEKIKGATVPFPAQVAIFSVEGQKKPVLMSDFKLKDRFIFSNRQGK